jgi:uncharacterized protein (DUF302 family)
VTPQTQIHLKEIIMLMLKARVTAAALALAAALPTFASAEALEPAPDSGIVRVRSALPIDQTIAAIEKDVAAKGIRFFSDIDQGQLAAGAGITLRPSHLLVFGNPPLGIKFLTSNPYAGLDWPVRMLVTQDPSGQVWIAYTDFAWIAQRHHIADRDADFKMASEVAASIAASAGGK